MDKNWLIRTKSNHILGPISKEKVLELYHNGSIKPDDEVCCGNGYWFFIREDDMVERFLTGNELQSFNPISEAKDVLTQTSTQPQKSSPPPEDITMVGGLNLSMLKQQVNASAGSPPVPDIPAPTHKSTPAPKEPVSSDTKKKNNVEVKAKPSATRSAAKPLKKQSYLKYVGILGFIVLILLVYYRKSIIRHLFEGEITSTVSFISSAHAQEEVPEKKKRLLESSVTLEKVLFKPSVGLDGFMVESSFDIEQIACADLNNEVYQLGVLLHPPEVINEKFMIKLRDCVLKLPEKHPLKKWMKWVAGTKPLKDEDQKKKNFLSEIINSQFNLITDAKVKNQIINALHDVPQNTIAEQILKSFLYLMIGNITRSDNILREIVSTPPRVNYEKTGLRPGLYHKLAVDEAAKIFEKLARHPADRRAFQLLALYIQSYYNDESLLRISDDVDTSDVESKLGLKYIESIAPSLVHYLKLTNMTENRRIKTMRNIKKYSLDEQSYWYWPFLEIDPLISETLLPELQRVEKEDQLWFIYLMDNEKLADLYSSKAGKSFLPGRRPYLKSSLDDHHTFMMSLYKLIELGDINAELVHKTSEHLVHE